MTTADHTNWVLIHNTDLTTFTRYLLAILSGLTAALLLRLYISHRTGRMNRWAGVGAVFTYVVISWAQIVAIDDTQRNLTLLNLAAFGAVSCSLIGTVKAMDIDLFKEK